MGVSGNHGPKSIVLALEVVDSDGGIADFVYELCEAIVPYYSKLVYISRNNDNKKARLKGRQRLKIVEIKAKTRLSYLFKSIIAAIQYDIDAVHCMHINLLPIAIITKFVSSCKVYSYYYGIEVFKKASILPRIYKFYIDRAICISTFTERNARVNGYLAAKTKVSIVNPGVSSAFLQNIDQVLEKKESYDNRGPVLITISRLSNSDKYKGIDKVLYCIPELRKQWPRMKYVIIGKGDDEKRLMRISEILGINENVVFKGFLSIGEKALELANADVFLMPSTGEGFGIVFLEALAAGLPVIGGNKDGSLDALAYSKNTIAINPDDRRELIDAINQSLSEKRTGVAYRIDGRMLRKIFQCKLYDYHIEDGILV